MSEDMREVYNELYSPGGEYWKVYSFWRTIKAEWLKQVCPHYFKAALYLRDCLKIDLNSTILEIGCGVGFLMRGLILAGYSNVFGIDISDKAIEYCGPDIDVSIADIKCTGYPDAEFDLAISIGTWEHILREDMEMSICESLRISKTAVFWIDHGNDPYHSFDELEDVWAEKFQKYTDRKVWVDRQPRAIGGSDTCPIIIGIERSEV